MARIRTVKPETWTSESLAQVTLSAERTFLGLLTQSDDHGRFRDNAAVIAGLLWPLRAEHTAVHVEDDLQQLGDAGLICRYGGCDGRRYLHIVTWAKHQRIDKPSQSRVPACPEHHAEARCGVCMGICAVFAEGSASTPGRLVEDSSNLPADVTTGPPRTHNSRGGSRPSTATEAQPTPSAAAKASETAGRRGVAEGSPKPPGNVGEGSAPGSRILDPGSPSLTGRTAPAPSRLSAQDLVGEYVAACAQRPPGDVTAHLGRVVKKLLDEGIEPEHVRAGLERFRAKPMHPSVLASLVNEAMNAPPSAPVERLGRPEGRHTVPAHRAWANPGDSATAYAEEL